MNAFSAGKRHVYDAVTVIHDVITTANPIRITSVNSTNQASDVCRRTISGSNNDNPLTT